MSRVKRDFLARGGKRGAHTYTYRFTAYRIPSCNFVCIYSLMGCVYVTVIGFGTACVHSGYGQQCDAVQV